MELLSDRRTPAQELNYALARERCQQSQKEILRGNNSNWDTTVAQLSPRKRKPALFSTPNITQYLQCWRCGGSFTPNHNKNCPAKQSKCNICKKTGTFRKNVQITDATTPQEQRTIFTKTTNTNKKCKN